MRKRTRHDEDVETGKPELQAEADEWTQWLTSNLEDKDEKNEPVPRGREDDSDIEWEDAGLAAHSSVPVGP